MSRIDPFFNMQPSCAFVDELKKIMHDKKPEWFGHRSATCGEVKADEMYLDIQFPDNSGLLKTAYEDFNRFSEVFCIKGNRYPIRIRQGESVCYEAYSISISDEECVVTAADTEGVRRALVYIEDELQRREGAYLPKGEIKRKPIIRTRISRGFFSPTNRPPKCIDELFDDVDYYPDEYLNKLAHDGINGLWIYTRFDELLPTKIFPEYGKNYAKRINKLRAIIAKCARYGIKIYIFAIEPAALPNAMTAKYPEVLGGDFWGTRSFCTHSEKGERYCIESTQTLCELVPDLGGLICITNGERVTSCASEELSEPCPCCGKYSKGEVLAHTADLLKEGMRRAGSNAEFISWTYGHNKWAFEDIENYVNNTPYDVVLMQNFEDAGYCEQLGKTRQAMDYWLSYTGPSQMFEVTAENARKTKKRMFAKMQVCCSHEIASVPYIPVPGILFDKYKAAAGCGVDGIVQCWYFGNYPSMMSKAAGELAFTDDFSDKESFLNNLAAIYYGRSLGEKVVKAWNYFENGYKNYPVNIMFSYYGPMHDGVVWELSLIPKNNPLPRNWLLLDKPYGDRIGECLQSGHSLDEALILADRMRTEWGKGLKELPLEAEELTSVAEAIYLLFSSGQNILEFYRLREKLGLKQGDLTELLEKMREIVYKEIENSKKMISLCDKDTRLGYHSEAEGFKFFPDKLKNRIKTLNILLDTEFTEVEERIEKGITPLEYYDGKKSLAYFLEKINPLQALWQDFDDGKAAFRITYDDENLYLDIKMPKEKELSVCFESRLFHPGSEILVKDGKIRLASTVLSHQSVFGEKIREELGKYKIQLAENNEFTYRLIISRKKLGWENERPIKLRIAVNGISWIREDEPVHTLGKQNLSPGEFGWLLTKK